jgi:AcrR family transcriptional regulator
MAQVKKPEVREAILASAYRLYSRQSYEATTLTQIAQGAGVSTANLYVYFGSKLDILYAIYDPWMRARLALLEQKLKRIDDPLARLRMLLRTLWREIPAEENAFVNNIMQALSMATGTDGYEPTLLRWMEDRIAGMVRDALPPPRRVELGRARLGHLLVMALDGYAIHTHINPRGAADDATIEAVAAMLLGGSRCAGTRSAAASRPPIRGARTKAARAAPRARSRGAP